MSNKIITNYAKKLLLAKIAIYMDEAELESCMQRLDMDYEELNRLSGTIEIDYLRQTTNNDDKL